MKLKNKFWYGTLVGIVFSVAVFLGSVFVTQSNAEFSRPYDVGKGQYVHTQHIVGDMYIVRLTPNQNK